MTDDYLNEALQYFLVDSKEDLDQINNDLVALEQNPEDEEVIARIFRAMHTMKGTGGCLGFDVIGQLAHHGEDLFQQVREGQLVVSSELISLLLETTDRLNDLLKQVESESTDTGIDISDILGRLDNFSSAAPTSEESGEYKEPPTPQKSPEAAAPAKQSDSDNTELSDMLEKVSPRIGDILVEFGYATQENVNAAIQQQQKGDPRHLGEILVELGHIEPTTVREILNIQDQRKAQQTKSEGFIRVNVTHLDHLMNLIGELVLTRNQLTQFVAIDDTNTGNAIAHRLSHITGELQESVMKTRLQPLQTVLGNFPRIIRDLSIACGKQVHLEIEGADTELDRSLIEAIRDPLTHLVRNAVDHGIETPAIRQERNKPPQGLLHVRASHTGGQVSIEINDDGAGINVDFIKERAVKKGIVRQDVAMQLSDRAALDLIFEPGFSTAETISDISGRGVGMDVVKTNIEKIGGLVEITTIEGAGSTFRLKIPLTLAIVPALIVEAGNERFAVPQTHVIELVQKDALHQVNKIEHIHGTPVIRLRNKLLPLLDAAEVLGLRKNASSFWENVQDENRSKLIVLKAENRLFCLRVDRVLDTEEIVVKSLNRHVHNIPVYSGATISGDGKVILILDAMGLAKHAKAVPETSDEILVEEVNEYDRLISDDALLLVCHNGDGGQLAFPISDVLRLEKVNRHKIATTGETAVLQYGDEIIPLIYIPGLLPERRKKKRAGDLTPLHNLRQDLNDLPIIIHQFNERHIGLVVDYIDDILPDASESRGEPSREFVSYTTVVSEKITEVIDIPQVIYHHVEHTERHA